LIILPAIDIKDGECVRLFQGDYATAHKVADSALDTAKAFETAGAEWLHTVDLNGAKAAKPVNASLLFDLAKNTGLKVEVGGGIRDLQTVDFYLENGIARAILGTAALSQPDLVVSAVKKYGERIAVGIDARDGKVAQNGWTQTSSVDYLDFAKSMEQIGVKYFIFTDISRDGALTGPNLEMLDRLNRAVSCNIIASGGVGSIKDISDLLSLNLYGVICGKSLYSGNLDLAAAVRLCAEQKAAKTQDLDRFFKKSELLPAVVQEYGTGEVLMLAYMNRESLQKTLETGYTWFFSRSRQELWNKGATSGHVQKVVKIMGDCDDDTLLLTVKQTGAACHTGSHSCFFNEVWRDSHE
jgi:phosphoribosylformimino-5-aminoimidazole carboxamide ribotide isomerase